MKFNMLTVADDNALRYVLPVFRMTSYFHIMGHIAREQLAENVTT